MKTILLLSLLVVVTWKTEAKTVLDVNGNAVVGFSASLTHAVTGTKAKQTVVFNKVQTNIGGNYNPFHGVFTAPRKGMYVFDWTMLTKDKKIGDSFLVVNNVIQMKNNCNSASGNGYRNGSSSVVLQLKEGDKVWVVIYTNHFIFGDNWSSFRGWLQSEI